MLDVLEALGKLDPAVLAQYAHAVVGWSQCSMTQKTPMPWSQYKYSMTQKTVRGYVRKHQHRTCVIVLFERPGPCTRRGMGHMGYG